MDKEIEEDLNLIIKDRRKNKMIGYYKLNNTILKLDVNKDVDLIRFNHYVMQKENYQRLKGELTKGYFYISARTVANDLKLSLSKAQRIIKKFVDLGIIVAKKLSKTNKQASIYFYSSINETDFETDFETDCKVRKVSNFNTLRGSKVTNMNIENETDFGTSKKELRKISSCCYIDREIEEDLNLEENEIKQLEELEFEIKDEKILLLEEYGFRLTKAQKAMVKKMDKERLKRAIETTVAQGGATFSYLFKVFLANKKAPAKAIADAPKTKNHLISNSRYILPQKSKKDKSFYMCNTKIIFDGKEVDTEELGEDDFNKKIEEMQRLKWV